MKHLSVELWQLILKHCSKRDLVQVRQVNRWLARVSAPSFFRHIHLCCFAFSLDHLRSLAQSDYAKHVRKITIYTTQIAACKRSEFEQILHFYDTRGPEDEEQKQILLIPRESWNEVWRSYEDCYNDQQAFLTESELRASFIDSLCMLPNLREVNLRPFEQTAPISVYSRPSVLPYNDPISNASNKITTFESSFSVQLAEDIARCAQGMFWQHDSKIIAWVLDALGERAKLSTNIPIQHLSISATLMDPILSLRNLEKPSHAGFDEAKRNIYSVLSQVRVFRFRSRLGVDNQDALLAEIRALIEACRKLESLTLDCGSWLGEACDGSVPLLAPFSSMLAANSWSQLRQIDLVANLRGEDMIKFFNSHCSTLDNLTVDGCVFDDLRPMLSEVRVLTKLRKVVLIHLTDFSCFPGLDCMWFPNGIQDDKALAWFLGKSNEEPAWEPEKLGFEFDSDSI